MDEIYWNPLGSAQTLFEARPNPKSLQPIGQLGERLASRQDSIVASLIN